MASSRRAVSALVLLALAVVAAQETPTACATATVTVVAAPTATPTALPTAADGCPLCPSCAPSVNCTAFSGYCGAYGECLDSGACRCQLGYGGANCASKICWHNALDGTEYARAPGGSCACDAGWAGIECQADASCEPLNQPGRNYTCNKAYFPTTIGYANCSIENMSLDAVINNWPSYASLQYFAESQTAVFQMVISVSSFVGLPDGPQEQFFCAMSDCEQSSPGTDEWQIDCATTRCRCYQGAYMCGNGAELLGSSFDLGIILDEINDSSNVRCRFDGTCSFTESIVAGFVGPISLTCNYGECSLPAEPTQPPVRIDAVTIGGAVGGAVGGLIVVLAAAFLLRSMYNQRVAQQLVARKADDGQAFAAIMTKQPSTFTFVDISYSLRVRDAVQHLVVGVSGHVGAGKMMAIIGASGAGKTTVLDILAQKQKTGVVGGMVLVNGKKVPRSRFKLIAGYVDQEDTLLPRLTVRETVQYAAQLRLPPTLSYIDKLLRAEAVLQILGIQHIGDRYVGNKDVRGISGGEKRRLSIACELVTMPQVLFLDEPTSGLDANSAFVVVSVLQRLAKQTGTTIIMSIHQPRSNIFGMFDDLLLLAHGQVVFSGPAADALPHFATIDFPCPPGYNPADYLIDLVSLGPNAPIAAEPRKLADDAAAYEMQSFKESVTDDSPRSGSTLLRTSTAGTTTAADVAAHEKMLCERYLSSAAHTNLQAQLVGSGAADGGSEEASERTQPSELQRFVVLASRAFKTFYREPMLMIAHFLIAVVIGLLLGGLFWKVDNSLAGVQNRLGFIFFLLAIFAFGALSSLELFSSERLQFIGERSNGYYGPMAYYASKVLFDNVPLRVAPPVIISCIAYFMIGFNAEAGHFFKFMLAMVLFNLTAGAFVLVYGTLFKNTSVASLLASLGVLFAMLFNGFLLNKDTIPPVVNWIQYLSFFNYAFEALIVNELNGVLIVDSAAGISISVNAQTILTKFGFNVNNYWRDIGILAAFYAGFLTLAFAFLKFLAVERR